MVRACPWSLLACSLKAHTHLDVLTVHGGQDVTTQVLKSLQIKQKHQSTRVLKSLQLKHWSTQVLKSLQIKQRSTQVFKSLRVKQKCQSTQLLKSLRVGQKRKFTAQSVQSLDRLDHQGDMKDDSAEILFQYPNILKSLQVKQKQKSINLSQPGHNQTNANVLMPDDKTCLCRFKVMHSKRLLPNSPSSL